MVGERAKRRLNDAMFNGKHHLNRIMNRIMKGPENGLLVIELPKDVVMNNILARRQMLTGDPEAPYKYHMTKYKQLGPPPEI